MSTMNRGLLDKAWDSMTSSQLWRSVFRHGYPDTPLNQSLVMMGNVFLHLHPVKVSRRAMKITYTWCLGGLSFFLFLVLTITGVFLMFYFVPEQRVAYADIQQIKSAVAFGDLVRNMHRWAAHLMVVTVTLHMVRVFYHGALAGFGVRLGLEASRSGASMARLTTVSMTVISMAAINSRTSRCGQTKTESSSCFSTRVMASCLTTARVR